MSGYCKDCGNAICVCDEIKRERESLGQKEGEDVTDKFIMIDRESFKKMQQQIIELKSELNKEKEVVDFYADTNMWGHAPHGEFSGHSYSSIVRRDNEKVKNIPHIIGGKRARTRQQERVKC